jgi:phage-related minor tail protein
MTKLTWRESQLIQQAQMWKQEARAANATIAKIYQLCSGGKGEPGNWNGAEPVRRKLAELNADLRGHNGPV